MGFEKANRESISGRRLREEPQGRYQAKILALASHNNWLGSYSNFITGGVTGKAGN